MKVEEKIVEKRKKRESKETRCVCRKRILHVRAHKYRGDEKRSAMKMSRCDGKTRVKKN